MKVDFGKGDVEVVYNFYTLYIYEQEFNSDLIKDVYGVARMDSSSGDVLFDFTTVNWTSITKALWAGAKCADPSLPRYEDWARQMGGGIDFMQLAGALINEIDKELFRFGVAPVSQ